MTTLERKAFNYCKKQKYGPIMTDQVVTAVTHIKTSNMTCQRKVQMTSFYGKAGIRRCGKPAVVVDRNGRHLCQRCFNMYEKKMKKIETK